MENKRNYKRKRVRLFLYTDGAARGNPGPAGVGIIIKNERGEIIKKYYEYIGIKTNNQAEYEAILKGLSCIQRYRPDEVVCFLDSQLITNQLLGLFKIKNSELKKYFQKVKKQSRFFPKISFFHIQREKNKEADQLANKAIDEQGVF